MWLPSALRSHRGVTACTPARRGKACSRLRRRGVLQKVFICTPTRRGPTFVRAKVGKTRSRGTDSPLTTPFLSLAVLDTNLDFSGAKNPNPYCAQIRSQGSRRRICPHRLAVPENIFALLACSIFSTAADAPPRCIRHWRRSAPHPHPPRPLSLRNRTINPSCTSPVKSTIYVISTQYFPIL